MSGFRRRLMMEKRHRLPENGIYAYYSDGSFRTYDNADSSAIGVAVITDEAKFVMHKDNGYYFYIPKFGGYGIDLSNAVPYYSNESDAVNDYDGAGNTRKLLNALNGVTDSAGTVGCPPAERCRLYFNGKGHLGSLGEWKLVFANWTNIENMFRDKLGAMFSINYYFTSTLNNPTSNVWRVTPYWKAWNSVARSYNNPSDSERILVLPFLKL